MGNDKNKFFCCFLTSFDITHRFRGLQDFEKKKKKFYSPPLTQCQSESIISLNRRQQILLKGRIKAILKESRIPKIVNALVPLYN